MAGSGWGLQPDLVNTRPADVLVENWVLEGNLQHLISLVTSPLKPNIFIEVSVTAGRRC